MAHQIKVLRNEITSVEIRNRRIVIAGVDDPEFWEVLAVKLPWKRTEE